MAESDKHNFRVLHLRGRRMHTLSFSRVTMTPTPLTSAKSIVWQTWWMTSPRFMVSNHPQRMKRKLLQASQQQHWANQRWTSWGYSPIHIIKIITQDMNNIFSNIKNEIGQDIISIKYNMSQDFNGEWQIWEIKRRHGTMKAEISRDMSRSL